MHQYKVITETVTHDKTDPTKPHIVSISETTVKCDGVQISNGTLVFVNVIDGVPVAIAGCASGTWRSFEHQGEIPSIIPAQVIPFTRPN